jgi:xylose isomerase
MYDAKPEHQFTFGLWTVGNIGRDPFGNPTRSPLTAPYIVHKLAELGAYGVNLHDNDLIPIDATPGERDQILRDFKKALAETGMKVPMATTNLFSDPAFKDGAFTNANAQIRGYAIQKSMQSMDLGADLGATTYVLWGGREGSEVDAGGNTLNALEYMREGLNYLAAYSQDQGYGYKFAIEPKPNEPRGDIYFPVVGSALAFINTLEQPDLFGVNPEFAHETMAGLNFVHAVAQAIDAKKLFHIDLNDQKIGRFDQDLRFGAENIKQSFLLVKLLEDTGYTGMKHFDAHALRTEDEAGVWAFAKGCIKNYLILAEKVKQFNSDTEIQALLEYYHFKDPAVSALTAKYSPEKGVALKAHAFDRTALGARGPGLELIDQLTMEIIMGIR